MNKNKISKELLHNVKILNTKKIENVFIFSNFFNKTQHFLNNFKYFYTPYRFANCFYLPVDADDLNILSMQNHVSFIGSNSHVQTLNSQQDFMNLSALTENKFFGQGGIFSHSNMGVATQSNIISIKALGKNGDGNSNIILDAMQWVYENHKTYNIGVVCMSFGAEGCDSFDPLSFGAEALWKAGIIVVAAAGNSGPNKSSIKSPGNNPYIITVGALDIKNFQVAPFSSRGPTVHGHKPDLLAPAVDIISCNNQFLPYTKMSGTSVATPIVAGVCAILKSKFPNLSNTEIKKFLLSHCTKITGNIDTEGAGYLKF